MGNHPAKEEEEAHMVICPIARAVHCTGCPFFKFCPVKSILGDYGKDTGDQKSNTTDEKDSQVPEAKPADSSAKSQ